MSFSQALYLFWKILPCHILSRPAFLPQLMPEINYIVHSKLEIQIEHKITVTQWPQLAEFCRCFICIKEIKSSILIIHVYVSLKMFRKITSFWIAKRKIEKDVLNVVYFFFITLRTLYSTRQPSPHYYWGTYYSRARVLAVSPHRKESRWC